MNYGNPGNRARNNDNAVIVTKIVITVAVLRKMTLKYHAYILSDIFTFLIGKHLNGLTPVEKLN